MRALIRRLRGPSSSPATPRDPLRVHCGRLLDRLGQLCLPLGVGLAAGYWLADLGVGWMPRMLEILSLFFAAALLLILGGQWLKGRVVRQTETGTAMRKRTLWLLALALVAAAVRLGVFWLEQPSPLTRLSAAELRRSFDLDTRRYREIDHQLERLLGRLEAGAPGSEPWHRTTTRQPLTAADERLLRDTWVAFYDAAFALDQIRVFYEDWYRFDPSRAQRPLLLQSYLLTYAAELALYDKSLRLTRLVLSRPEAEKFLDAPHPERELPEHTFSILRQEFQGIRDQARVVAGERYLDFLDRTLKARRLAAELGFAELPRRIDHHLATIRTVAPLERAVHTVRGDLQLLRRAVRRTWYPTQKAVAEWLGDVKTRRVGHYLIRRHQLVEAARHLEPGDILVGRKNWYLSNVALPGFWPHAMLYLGDALELARTFDTPEVRAHLASLGAPGLSFPEFLERTWPAAWRRYLAGVDGEPVEVLEAVGEGVVLSSLAHSAGDYLAALRPRVSTLAKAQAILEAFRHLGKPYDFDFDFATDHALVCSELVWRSYRPAAGKEGLELPLTELAGRLTLSPNEIVRLYAEEHGEPRRQLDFVYFLDGREREVRAVVAGEEAFRASHARFKWDLFQR